MRDAAFEHAFNLKKALDGALGGPANFIALGDLNTMGIDDSAPYSRVLDFSSAEEIERLGKWAARRGMRPVPADVDATWWNASPHYVPTALDHVLAAAQMDIRRADGEAGTAVLGWPKKPESGWASWIEHYSDHGLVYFEVWA